MEIAITNRNLIGVLTILNNTMPAKVARRTRSIKDDLNTAVGKLATSERELVESLGGSVDVEGHIDLPDDKGGEYYVNHEEILDDKAIVRESYEGSFKLLYEGWLKEWNGEVSNEVLDAYIELMDILEEKFEKQAEGEFK